MTTPGPTLLTRQQGTSYSFTKKRQRNKIISVARGQCNVSGPAQQDFEWGGLSVSQTFFWGGGGGGGAGVGAEACCPGKIRVLVTLRYRKVDLILTNSVLKRNAFTT